MVFCGQCGLQLAPGSTGCPRCGAVTEPDFSAEDPHLYDPTIVSSSFGVPPAADAQPPTVSATPPQQLVLRPDGLPPPYGAASPFEPTSAMPPRSISASDQRGYSGYPPQNGTIYPSQQGQYPGYMPQSEPGYAPLPPKRRGRGRNIVLLAILFVLLLLLGATAALVLKPSLLQGFLGNPTATPVSTQSALSPSDQARAVMIKYYNDINAQDYQGAYNLWGTAYQNQNPYSGFAAGYAHTRHDDLTINTLTPLSDGTVSVNITIDATEDTTSGIVHSIYNGTYIVGQEQGTWKLLSGTFHKVG